MRFGILGSLEVTDDEGRSFSLLAPKQQAVLAVLLLHANEVVSSDRLIEDLWAGSAPASAAKALQMHVSRLRRALGDGGSGGEGRLVTAPGGYLLRVAPGELDAERFGRMVEEGQALARAGRWEPAAERFGEALGLWRGRPLSDFEYESFAQAEIARLSELHVSAVEQRVAAEIAVGREAQVIAELERLVREYPYRERLCGQLMLALYRTGRQADALQAYRDARAVLIEELGVEPSAELRQLQAQILVQAPALDLAAGSEARDAAVSARAPEGTIALLFTDIEGSTRLATELGASWPAVLEDHHALLSAAVAGAGGFVEATEGDALFATFVDAQAAARATVSAMRSLRSHPWPEPVGELRVRMGLHVGRVQRTETGYVGLEVHRAARVAAAAHGDQLLLTAAARELVGDELVCESVGVHRLKDFPAPAMLYCAAIDGRGAACFPPPRTESVRPTNLPAGRPQLIGRETELAEVLDAVGIKDERLVTITGRGGAGKTSLGLLAGSALLDQHPGGVWWVDLTTVGSAAEMAVAIAAVVGAGRELDVPIEAAITTRLRNSGPTLLVLDNMEHVLAAAEWLCGLLDRLRDVRLLVTSRLPLRVDPERLIALDGLDEGSALELVARSLGRRGRAALTDADGGALREIVRLLDGLPLALELAAARLSVLTAVQLRDRLRESIDVLGEARGGRPARQRSLRAVLDSTLALLDPSARAFFVRMGAFVGPVELEELERVLSGDGVSVLEALAELVDAALVQRVETGDGTVRFGLPEALRQIAADLLDSGPDGKQWRREHAARQLELQWAARAFFVPRPVHDAAIAADAEAAAALQWARDIGDPVAAPLAAARAILLAGNGRIREALAILQPLLDSPPADPEVYGQAQLAYSNALGPAGKPEESLAAANRAVDQVTQEGLVLALTNRALAHLALGQVENALADNERATALARDLSPDALFTALMFEAQTRLAGRQLDLATALRDEADQIGADSILSEHSFDGDLALVRGQPREAAYHYALSLEFAQDRSDHLQVFNDMCGLADALAMNGDDIEALEVAGIAEAHINDMGGTVQYAWHIDGQDSVLEAEKRLGVNAAADARTRGREVDAGYRVTRACELARGTKRLMHSKPAVATG